MSAVMTHYAGWTIALAFFLLVVASIPSRADQNTSTLPPPVQMTDEQDHQRMMDFLVMKGHTDAPNWPYFITFASRYFMSTPQSETSAGEAIDCPMEPGEKAR